LGWGAAEADRLTEARMTAVEDLWEAELRLGGHTRAVDELERYTALHPARERLAGLLMVALYRCGRAQHALDVYRELRERMAEELGVDPGPRLEETYTAILRHDASPAIPGSRRPHRTDSSSSPGRGPLHRARH
jgi:DNA-binding SARP family transcriptional activator